MKNEHFLLHIHGNCRIPCGHAAPTSSRRLDPHRTEPLARRGDKRPRRSGKSTLAQHFLERESPNYFDLEYPRHTQRLEHATQTLEHLQGLVVIDEVQLKPDLFPLLRVLMDRSSAAGQYLLLGSASPHLLRQTGKSLLWRVETIEVGGFDLAEVGADSPSGRMNLPTGIGCAEAFPVLTPVRRQLEGFAMDHVLRIAQPDQAYSWATHQGAELDLLLFKGNQRVGVEFKRSDAPRVTPQACVSPCKTFALMRSMSSIQACIAIAWRMASRRCPCGPCCYDRP